MQLIGTIIVFMIGVLVGIALYASGYMGFLPDYVSTYSSQSPSYQSPTYPADQTYPTNQNSTYQSGQSQYTPPANDTSSTYGSQTPTDANALRLSVRCNVQPEDMPYGCGAAYTLVNRTPRSLYVTFEGGDTQVGNANAPMTVSPGQSIGGNASLTQNVNGSEAQDSDLTAAPPFIIEIQDCSAGSGYCANY